MQWFEHKDKFHCTASIYVQTPCFIALKKIKIKIKNTFIALFVLYFFIFDFDVFNKLFSFLNPDMNSFIPEEDIPAFEKFLSDNNLGSRSPQAGGVPHPPGGAGPDDSVPRPPPAGGAGDADNFVLEDVENILTTNF